MERHSHSGRDRSRLAAVAVAISAALIVGASCSESEQSLTPAAERGRSISRAKGCAGCHGQNGEGGVGPAWVGLAGSNVELYDGSVIMADDAYLVRAIKEPQADLLAEYAIQMPSNDLSDDEVDAIVTYIKELGG